MSRFIGEVLGTGAGLLIAAGSPEISNADQAVSQRSGEAQIGNSTPFGNSSSLSPERTLTPNSKGEGPSFASINDPSSSVMDKIVRSCVLLQASNIDVEYGYMPGSLRKGRVTIVSKFLMSGDPDGDGPGESVPCPKVTRTRESYRLLIENSEGVMVTNGPQFSESNIPAGAKALVEMDSPGAGDKTVTYEGIPTKRKYTGEGTRDDDRVQNVGLRFMKEIFDLRTGKLKKVVVKRFRSPDHRKDSQRNGS